MHYMSEFKNFVMKINVAKSVKTLTADLIIPKKGKRATRVFH